MRLIGPLTERITVQTATSTTDAQGGRAKTWSTLATMWAEFVSRPTSERLQANQALGAEVAAQFRIRRRTDVTVQMRVVWSPTFPPSAPARTLEVRSVVPIDDGRTWMLLDCTEVA